MDAWMLWKSGLDSQEVGLVNEILHGPETDLEAWFRESTYETDPELVK